MSDYGEYFRLQYTLMLEKQAKELQDKLNKQNTYDNVYSLVKYRNRLTEVCGWTLQMFLTLGEQTKLLEDFANRVDISDEEYARLLEVTDSLKLLNQSFPDTLSIYKEGSYVEDQDMREWEEHGISYVEGDEDNPEGED